MSFAKNQSTIHDLTVTLGKADLHPPNLLLSLIRMQLLFSTVGLKTPSLVTK